MEKVKLGRVLPTMPLPICLVGATNEGKANFNTIAWLTMLSGKPPMMGVVMGGKRYTKDGIRENGTFSVNIPSVEMMKIVDYCGMTSGYRTDKSDLFKVFHGALETAPMIDECPINIECRFVREIPFPGTDMVVGEIAEVYVSEELSCEGVLDLTKLHLPIFLMPDGPYHEVGRVLSQAYKVKKKPM
ncbi:MAG TPA: flavin reductase family protein [Methanomassiliicoccales archaeon]|nr:flavin reductase family protein [Methanomassiliicoccales archaeon]